MLNNIPVNVIKNDKFKNIIVRIYFLTPFSEDNASIYSMLVACLNNSSKKYNTKKKKMNYQSKLFCGNVFFSTYPNHKTNIISFSLNILNEKYSNEPELLKKGILFMKEFLLNPNCDQKGFNKKIFDEEKNRLIDDIKTQFNNVNYYAMNQAIKNACPGEVITIDTLGKLENINKITPQSLYSSYLDLLNNSEKVIYIIGDVEEDVEKYLKPFNSLYSQKLDLEKVLYDNKVINEVKEIKQKRQIKQAILIMIYRTTINVIDPEYDHLIVFSDMLGGLSNSNLFQTVREENSLCYSIYANVINDAKIFYCNAGIDKVNYQKTVDLIKSEIDKYQNGVIDDELLETAKLNAISNIKETMDSPKEIMSQQFSNYLLNYNIDMDKQIELISNITKEDIIKVAKSIKLDTIYLLSE